MNNLKKWRGVSQLELHFAKILIGASEESHQLILKNVFNKELDKDDIEHGVLCSDLLFHDRFVGTVSAVYPISNYYF